MANLPLELEKLKVGSLARWPFDALPQGLHELEIADHGCTIPANVLHDGLQTLVVSATTDTEFAELGPLGSLPAGLKVLRFDSNARYYPRGPQFPVSFEHPLGALPAGLETLHLPARYAYPLPLLPPTLQRLRLPQKYRHPVRATGPVTITPDDGDY